MEYINNDQLIEQTIQEVEKDKPVLCGPKRAIEFIQEVSKKFLQNKIDQFPTYCEVMRFQFNEKKKLMEDYGRKGKYTNSYGWSEDMTIKWEVDIPEDLYFFMIRFVYHDFWNEDNKKITDEFLKRILRGDDPLTTLMWAKAFYGSNKQEGIVM